jgi:hypothetical protein
MRKNFLDVDQPVLPRSTAICPGTFAGGELEPGTFHFPNAQEVLLPPGEQRPWVDDRDESNQALVTRAASTQV